jgi:hypothetical protein
MEAYSGEEFADAFKDAGISLDVAADGSVKFSAEEGSAAAGLFNADGTQTAPVTDTTGACGASGGRTSTNGASGASGSAGGRTSTNGASGASGSAGGRTDTTGATNAAGSFANNGANSASGAINSGINAASGAVNGFSGDTTFAGSGAGGSTSDLNSIPGFAGSGSIPGFRKRRLQ